MLLDTRNQTLDGVQLSNLEYRFLATLVNNELIMYNKIFEFIYHRKARNFKEMRMCLSNHRIRIMKKIKLDLTPRNNFGYILGNIIEVV